MSQRTLQTRDGSALRPSARGFAAFAAAAVLLIGLVAGCTSASVPRTVLNVPGSYTADLWAPTPGSPSGGSRASVLMCLDSVSAVHLDGAGIGSIKLEWSGVEYLAIDGGNPVSLTTPVLQPGCGLLTFGVDCCRVDHYLTITATKV